MINWKMINHINYFSQRKRKYIQQKTLCSLHEIKLHVCFLLVFKINKYINSTLFTSFFFSGHFSPLSFEH